MSKDLTPYQVEEFCVEVLETIEPIENIYENTGKTDYSHTLHTQSGGSLTHIRINILHLNIKCVY